jgi:hypothetical protein
MIYGRETFLYAMHFLPLLIALVALGALARWRGTVLALAGVLTIAAGITNARQLDRAITTVRQIAGYTAWKP